MYTHIFITLVLILYYNSLQSVICIIYVVKVLFLFQLKIRQIQFV